jgi:hypothetical protein
MSVAPLGLRGDGGVIAAIDAFIQRRQRGSGKHLRGDSQNLDGSGMQNHQGSGTVARSAGGS